MIRALSILLLSTLTASAADLTLAWDYDPAELSTNLQFRIYSSTNVATLSTNSPVTVVSGTSTTVRVTMVPERRFWFVTASNFWGESTPSNIADVPRPATNITGLRLTRP